MRTINTEFAVKRDGKLDFWATYSPQVLPRLVQSIEHSQLAFNEAVDGSVWFVGAFKRQVDRINRGELVG